MAATLYDQDALIKAVINNGADKYYEFGVALGMNHGEINRAIGTIPADESKLLAIITRLKAAVDDITLETALTKACQELSSPIWGDVQRDIQAQAAAEEPPTQQETPVQQQGPPPQQQQEPPPVQQQGPQQQQQQGPPPQQQQGPPPQQQQGPPLVQQQGSPQQQQQIPPPVQQQGLPPLLQQSEPPPQQQQGPAPQLQQELTPAQPQGPPPVQQQGPPPVQQQGPQLLQQQQGPSPPPQQQPESPPVQQQGLPLQQQQGPPFLAQQEPPPVQQQGSPQLQQQGPPLVPQQGPPPVQQQQGPLPVQQQEPPPVQQQGAPPVQQQAAAPVQQQGVPPVQQQGAPEVQQQGPPLQQQQGAPPQQQQQGAPPQLQQGLPPAQQQEPAPVQQQGPPPQLQQEPVLKSQKEPPPPSSGTIQAKESLGRSIGRKEGRCGWRNLGLDTPASQFPKRLHKSLGGFLDEEDEIAQRDWRQLVAKLGLSEQDKEIVRKSDTKTKAALRLWQDRVGDVKSSGRALSQVLREMGRFDIIDEVARFLGKTTTRSASVSDLTRQKFEAIIEAAKRGDNEILATLIGDKTGAQIDDEFQNMSQSPLHAAVYYDHLHTVEFLVERGFDTNRLNYEGRTPRDLAEEDDMDILNLLDGEVLAVKRVQMSANGKRQSLARTEAPLARPITQMVEPIQKSTHVDRKVTTDGPNNAWTPLHTAAAEGDIGAVKFLIKNEADISKRNRKGFTAEDLARKHKHDEVSDYLRMQRENCERGQQSKKASLSKLLGDSITVYPSDVRQPPFEFQINSLSLKQTMQEMSDVLGVSIKGLKDKRTEAKIANMRDLESAKGVIAWTGETLKVAPILPYEPPDADGPTESDKIGALIVTTVEAEFDAVVKVLKQAGCEKFQAHPITLEGEQILACVATSWKASETSRPIKVAVTKLTDMGVGGAVDIGTALQAAVDCNAIESDGFVAVAGVCTGHKDETKFGDVMVPRKIWIESDGQNTKGDHQTEDEFVEIKKQLKLAVDQTLMLLSLEESWVSKYIPQDVIGTPSPPCLLDATLGQLSQRFVESDALRKALTTKYKWPQQIVTSEVIEEALSKLVDMRYAERRDGHHFKITYDGIERVKSKGFPRKDDPKPRIRHDTAAQGPKEGTATESSDWSDLGSSVSQGKAADYDMEGYTFLSQAQKSCKNMNQLFVKVVSDQATEEYKMDYYQKYAACVAAAFVLRILEDTPSLAGGQA